MINIDTDTLKQLSAAAQTASNELEDAMALLMQVTTHEDWGCQEKVSINQLIDQNRSSISTLRDDTSRFTQAVEQVTEEFVQKESGISSLFESVESVLQAILSTPCETVHTGTWGGETSPIPIVDAGSLFETMGKES